MDEMDMIFYGFITIGVIMLVITGFVILDVANHEENYGLGSTVTTSSEYEHLTNDSFTGVVVKGEGWRDPALTVRSRNGMERRIATEFLEPLE